MNNSRNAKTKKANAGIPCPGCRMPKNEWPGEGYTFEGQSYCCQGCAEGTGCVCLKVGNRGFSREGQVATAAKPRPGKQRSGAPAPKGELSGERDNRGTDEAIDESGQSAMFDGPRKKRK